MWSILTNNWNTFLSGLGFTLAASILALIGSLIVGTLFALMEITLAFYVIVPQFIVKIDGFTAGTIGLLIYTSAFIAETVRAGIEAVPSGQMEGARSIGMTYTQAMTQIIFPQAFKIVIPPLGNQFINLVKNSAVELPNALSREKMGDRLERSRFYAKFC